MIFAYDWVDGLSSSLWGSAVSACDAGLPARLSPKTKQGAIDPRRRWDKYRAVRLRGRSITISSRARRSISVKNTSRTRNCSKSNARRSAPLQRKLYNFPSPAIQTGENSMICRLSCIPEARMTVKFSSRTPRKLLPPDLPSKRFA